MAAVVVRRREDRVGNEQSAAEARRAVEGQNIPDECPICYDDQMDCPVDTNCNHTFCAPCILEWCRDHQSTCPVCRRQVTLLMGSDHWNAHNTQVFGQVDDYNQHHQNERGYLASLFDLPALYQHLWRDYFRIGVIPLTAKCYFFFLAMVVILYVLSPLDLIPEIMFGIIGLLDDVIAVVLAVLYVAEQYRNLVINAGHR